MSGDFCQSLLCKLQVSYDAYADSITMLTQMSDQLDLTNANTSKKVKLNNNIETAKLTLSDNRTKYTDNIKNVLTDLNLSISRTTDINTFFGNNDIIISTFLKNVFLSINISIDSQYVNDEDFEQICR